MIQLTPQMRVLVAVSHVDFRMGLNGLQGVCRERLALGGTHSEIGRVTLGQLLATWIAHDLSHLARISRARTRTRSARGARLCRFAAALGESNSHTTGVGRFRPRAYDIFATLGGSP